MNTPSCLFGFVYACRKNPALNSWIQAKLLFLQFETIQKDMAKGKNAKKRGILIILLNILVMVIAGIALVLVAFRWMESYTRHGQYISVPDVAGMYEDEAAKALAAAGLKYEVSDYKFDSQLVEGGVIEQKPKPGAFVKEGRKIYLTLNSGKEPVKAVPDLADNSSLRAAESQLLAAGFKLTATEYIDGDLDWVYEIRYKGNEIKAGTEIPVGSVLTIVAGNGTPVEEIEETDSLTVIDTDFF